MSQTIPKLTSINLKPEFKNLRTADLHLSHFNIDDSIKLFNRIEYIDDKGIVIVLKDRGCVKPKHFKQVPRRILKFRKLEREE